eukprot:UC4_evm1s880
MHIDSWLCASSSSTATQDSKDTATVSSSGTERLMNAASFPVVNPYGNDLSLATLVSLRDHERRPQREYIELVKQGKAKPKSDSDAYIYQGKGKWPYARTERPTDIASPTRSPKANSMFRPVLDEMVRNVKNGTPPMPYGSFKVNAKDAYTNPTRFEAEKSVLFSRVPLIAGLSKDLPGPNTYMRFEVVGKSFIITRDDSGHIHCLENACRHRGMELITKDDPCQSGDGTTFVCPYHSWSYDSKGKLIGVPFSEGFRDVEGIDANDINHQRNLIEVPSAEKAGIIFIIPSPEPGTTPADIEEAFTTAMPLDLEKELSVLKLHTFHRTVEQTFRMPANWKLGIDTFGEIAKGEIDKANLDDITVLDHCTQVYHLAPNMVLLVGASVTLNYFWPGSHPGESIVTVAQFNYTLPKSDLEKERIKNSFGSLLDVVATEDFPLLPRMQENFERNPKAEIIFGRHEPMLTNRHKYFEKMVLGKYQKLK